MTRELSQSPELKVNTPTTTDASSNASDTPTLDKQYRVGNFIRKVDRIKFFLNFLNVIISAALVTKDAKYFAIYNAILTTTLIAHRTYEYYLKGWHFYMIDFCYLVNWIVIFQTVFFPKSEIMFFAAFALSMGPIFNAVSYYRCTLAFHSTEKTTSFLTHSSPPLAMFLIHWHDKSKYFYSAINGVQEFGPSFMLKWYGGVLALYGTWVIFYSIVLFKIFRPYIVKNKFMTLYDHAMGDPRTARELRSKGEKWTQFMFVWVHFRYVMQFITLTAIFYYSYWIGLVWVIYNHLVGIYNGGTYYIVYHSERYIKTLFYSPKAKEEDEKYSGN